MAKGRSNPWQEGCRAWERLDHWRDRAFGRPEAADRGEASLAALADIGTLRRLLEQTELEAVRTARRHRRSWAEIATRLGVTRQSAWERWRDLDEDLPPLAAAAAPGAPASADSVPDDAAASAAAAAAIRDADAEEQAARARALAAEVLADTAAVVGLVPIEDGEAADDGSSRSGRRSRRRQGKTIVVPNVVGRTFQDARGVLAGWGFPSIALVSSTRPGEGLVEVAEPETGALVVSQAPESGARVAPGAPVRLWIGGRGDGSAGVREPRRPFPSSPPARELLPETVREAVG